MKKLLSIIILGALAISLCACAPSVKAEGFVQIGDVYDGVKDFSEGFASVRKDGKWGVIDAEGNQIVDFIYEDMWYFKEGRCAVKTQDGWGFIDTEGNLVIDDIYEGAWYFSEGLAVVKQGGKCGYITPDGSPVTEMVYVDAGNLTEGMAYVSLGDGYGFIDSEGNLISDYLWFEGKKASEGLVEVFDKNIQVDQETGEAVNNSGFLNTKGELVIDKVFYDADIFSEGLCAVKIYDADKGYIWGYINTDGEMVIGYRYTSATPFSQGRAAVEEDHLYKYIDAEGNEITDNVYSYAYEFSCSLARVGIKSGSRYTWKYIGLDGEVVIEGYSGARDFAENAAAVEKNGKWGLIDTEGNVLISCKYGQIGDMSEGIVWLKNGSKYVFAKQITE